MPFMTLSYKKIHYTDYKPDSEPPFRETFIFTHGLGSSQNFYSALLPAFLAENFRCITFDTTGSGRSPYTYVEQDIDSLSRDVIALMDNLQVAKAVVVGHSMGGIVAANVAAEFPDRIVASIWLCPVSPSSGVADVFEKRIQLVEEKGMEPLANMIPNSAVGARATPLAKAFIRELLLGQNPAGYISNCRVIASAKVPDYAKIKCPVLVLAGGEDKSAPSEGCEKMFERIGVEEKKIKVLKGVGHWPCIEALEEVTKAILEFYHEIQ
ncbi:3-oxoadipate enol-lactone hydrolase [Tothia fuscella]|uniref:3-oxoadipate enol-lactone hydrolase n=1 Tax=Tothia fuscella TaxID=1048955 RepID=A0A9P4U3X8_9PEZI|nr:3-oxoadipate enol-lactone hydrolase [Tothia fuscella]